MNNENCTFSMKVWCSNGRGVRITNLDSSTNFYTEVGNGLATIKSSIEKISKIKFYIHKPNHKQLLQTYTFSSKEDIYTTLHYIEDAIVNFYN